MRANDHRVNRLARQALIKLGQPPAEERLYCVQLMQWALAADVAHRLNLDLERLEEAVTKLAALPEAEAMGILKLAEDAPARPGLQPRHLINKPPRELAASLLQDFQGKLGGSRAWFTPVQQTETAAA
jgi:hypothetical protein